MRFCFEYSKSKKNFGFGSVFGSFPIPLLSKYRVLCLYYVLLCLNAGCYAVKYEEQISSQLLICSPRQISLHYDNIKKYFQNWFWKEAIWKKARFFSVKCDYPHRAPVIIIDYIVIKWSVSINVHKIINYNLLKKDNYSYIFYATIIHYNQF